jgi:hypothetical protein
VQHHDGREWAVAPGAVEAAGQFQPGARKHDRLAGGARDARRAENQGGENMFHVEPESCAHPG